MVTVALAKWDRLFEFLFEKRKEVSRSRRQVQIISPLPPPAAKITMYNVY